MAGRKLAAVMLLLCAVLVLSACGKRGTPQPPGPPDQVTFPRVYPTR